MSLVVRALFLAFLFIITDYAPPAFSQTPASSSTTSPSTAPILLNISDTTTQPTLNKLNKQLDSISKTLQFLSRSANRQAFNDLLDQAQDVSAQATKTINILKPRVAGYDQALTMINTATDEKDQTTDPKIVEYRKTLLKNKKDLNTKIQQALIIQLEANSQVVQIQQALSNIQQVQLFTHTISPLTYQFWQQISQNYTNDQKRISTIYNDFIGLFTNAWDDDGNGRILIFIGLISTLIIIFVIQPIIEKIVAQIVERIIPPTRLRRSIMTLFSAIFCSFIAGISATILLQCLNYDDNINHPAFDFAQKIIHQLYFCGFILGLYRGFLAVKKPQWRLLPINDKTAYALNILPTFYALMVFLLGVVKYITNTSGVSFIAQQLCNGFFTCIACLLFIAIPLRLKSIGQSPIQTQTQQGINITFILIAIGIPIFCIACVGAVFSGYIYLGFSMCVWLNWVILIFSTLSLLKMLLNDATALIFDPDRWLGKKMQAFGIRPQSMEQLSTIITGLITLCTIILIIASIFSPGKFDIASFGNHLATVLNNLKLGSFSFSFYALGQALFALIIGMYCIRVVRSWLNKKLFPKTELDNATRTSIDTIFNYCCWVIIAIIVLSILGVTTQNITWIVSALSVGIGFGLQAIVQNFVSGLILLTERPVRIGDSVTIGGVKGTVKSIRVRATEIQLSDFSTLIVPNSQLITSSVQNSTRSRHLGLISVKLPVITPTQLETARKLILDIMNNHPEVVETPKPSVLIDSITEIALVISITCYVNTTSSTDGVKSDILSEYLINMNKIATTTYLRKIETEESFNSEDK